MATSDPAALVAHGPSRAPRMWRGLIAACHPGPTLAVTLIAAGLGQAAGLPPLRLLWAVAAVLAGQLSIGWSNDLLDRVRDRRTGRRDKPVATGDVSVSAVRIACALAVVATVPLSLLCGLEAGLVHLGIVAAGWAYNLGLKSTRWSWLPYAWAFGSLPLFVFLAHPHGPGTAPTLPPWWGPLAGALLGVGAHLVNALPDLADDEATGVRGLPHRLGARRSAVVATVLLVGASALVTADAAEHQGPLIWGVLGLVGALGLVALTGSGRTPFRAAVGIALLDVLVLVWVL